MQSKEVLRPEFRNTNYSDAQHTNKEFVLTVSGLKHFIIFRIKQLF